MKNTLKNLYYTLKQDLKVKKKKIQTNTSTSRVSLFCLKYFN